MLELYKSEGLCHPCEPDVQTTAKGAHQHWLIPSIKSCIKVGPSEAQCRRFDVTAFGLTCLVGFVVSEGFELVVAYNSLKKDDSKWWFGEQLRCVRWIPDIFHKPTYIPTWKCLAVSIYSQAEPSHKQPGQDCALIICCFKFDPESHGLALVSPATEFTVNKKRCFDCSVWTETRGRVFVTFAERSFSNLLVLCMYKSQFVPIAGQSPQSPGLYKVDTHRYELFTDSDWKEHKWFAMRDKRVHSENGLLRYKFMILNLLF